MEVRRRVFNVHALIVGVFRDDIVYLRNVREAILVLFALVAPGPLLSSGRSLAADGPLAPPPPIPCTLGMSASTLQPQFLSELRRVLELEMRQGSVQFSSVFKPGIEVPRLASPEAISNVAMLTGDRADRPSSSHSIISEYLRNVLPDPFVTFRRHQRVPFLLRVSSQLLGGFLARLFEHAMNRTQMLGYERCVKWCLCCNFTICVGPVRMSLRWLAWVRSPERKCVRTRTSIVLFCYRTLPLTPLPQRTFPSEHNG